MANSIVELQQQYGENFEGLFRDDRAEVAGVILLWISLKDNQAGRFLTLLDLSGEMSRYLIELSDESIACLCEISLAKLDHATLLDICSSLLAGCR
jgi:hypothetical protein